MSCVDISDQPQVEGLCQPQFQLSAPGLEGDVPNNHSKRYFDTSGLSLAICAHRRTLVSWLVEAGGYTQTPADDQAMRRRLPAV